MKHHILKIVVSLVFLLVFFKADSQPQSFNWPTFEHISTSHGLSNKKVYRILQDHYGFLWFATQFGINRYDGYTFKSYIYNPSDSNTITAAWYRGITEDADGIIWLSTASEGIYSFNPITEKFMHYRHEPNNINSLASDLTNGISADKNGTIWIATQNGLDAFDTKKKKFTHFQHNKGDSTTISTNVLFAQTLDNDGNLWLTGASPVVDCFDTRTGKVIHHFVFAGSDRPLNNWVAEIYGISTGRNGNIWVATSYDGIYCFNSKTKITKHFSHTDHDPTSISDCAVNSIYEDESGNLWIGTDISGLEFYDHVSGSFFHSTPAPTDQQQINVIECVMEDRDGKIWIGTNNGIFATNPGNNRFFNVLAYPNTYSALNRSFNLYRDSSGKFYCTFYGMYLFDTATKKLSPFEIKEGGKNIFADQIFTQVYRDHEGFLWFCTGTKGIISYDEKTGQHRRYHHDANDSHSLSSDISLGMIEDRRGRYWITTWGGGLNQLDPATGKCRAFMVHDGPNSISSNTLVGIHEAPNGILYIGSWNGGMITFNPDTETFKIFRHDPNDPQSLSCDIAFNYIYVREDLIWIGTVGGGINAFNPLTGKFRAFTSKDGLLNDAVNGLVKDDEDRIWIGTYNGISCFIPPLNPFDPKSEFQFRNYDIADEVVDDEINYLAGFKDSDGKIYFGTTAGGFFYFDPASLKGNETIPPIYITDIRLFNRSLHPMDENGILVTSPELTHELKLKYYQNTISFTFTGLNYFHSEKNKYAYRLDGLDKDWIYTNATDRSANYTNLAPGTYTFFAKAANNDGVWNEIPTSVHLIIAPPYWQTWWFRTLILAALVMILYVVYRARLNQVLRVQHIRNKIASDLHDDIGSTLNSISVYSEVARIKSKQHLQELDMIGESSRKVIEAMSDIVWTINSDNDQFEQVILRMRSFTSTLLQAKKIELTFYADEALDDLKLTIENRRNFYLLFKEALNNIVKYSEAKKVTISLLKDEKFIRLQVKDNGIGFDVNNPEQGNGINSMRRRAKEMKAVLQIASRINSGTTIELTLMA